MDGLSKVPTIKKTELWNSPSNRLWSEVLKCILFKIVISMHANKILVKGQEIEIKLKNK